MTKDIFDARSVLFLPASNARAIAKAREAGADMVVLDLEDAVRAEDKDEAREAAVAAVEESWAIPVAIRVNGATSPRHQADVEAVARSKADVVIVPRAHSAGVVEAVAKATGKPAMAMIETAAGVIAAPAIAAACSGLIAGTNDLRADLRLPLGAGREAISAALQWIVLSARAAGILAIDGVFNGLDDEAGLLAEAHEGRALGFDGKSLIQPKQIAPCHEAFAPTEAEIERAKALVEAFSGGAERMGNEMIERMHVEAAKRVLARQ
jgi:citrate lyase subunit beta/citryl-CoA lyase